MEMLKISDYEQTGISMQLPLKGKNIIAMVVRIPLEDLHYNIQNGRVATRVAEYVTKEGSLPENEKELNEVFEGFIVKSDPDALNKTKNNISKIGQTEPAVVLKDGTVIDGNRRFTALRQLARENGSKFAYIDATILDQEKYNAKEIRSLEFNLQHAREEKVDYDAIERLVDVYRSLIVEGHDFTVSEFASETGKKVSEVEQQVQLANLMVEYLESIDQPEAFHIARNQKLGSALVDVNNVLKKVPAELQDDAKELMFATLATSNDKISSRIRKMKPLIIDSASLQELSLASDSMLDELSEHFRQDDVKSEIKDTDSVNVPVGFTERFDKLVSDFNDSKTIKKAQKAPIVALDDAMKRLGYADVEEASLMSKDDQDVFARKLADLLQKASDMKTAFESM